MKTHGTVTGARIPPKSAKLAAWEKTGAAPQASATDLKTIAQLASEQLAAEARIAALQEKLKAEAQIYDRIRLTDLPQALSAAGMSAFTLGNGAKVEVKRDYFCSLTGQYKPAALAWTRENELEEIISNTVTLSFGKGYSPKQIEKVLKMANDFKNCQATTAETINTTTFKAVVRERLENGEAVPVAELGITIQDAAKITAPKRPVEI